MKKRVSILMALVGVFCLLVAFFPDIPTMRPSRLAKELPDEFGDWVGSRQEPGAREKEVLAGDTEFERVEYSDSAGNLPPVQVSIVFSGKNLSQSIHRPEVCLRAQGWTFVNERYHSFPGSLPGGEDLPVKELICKRPLMRETAEGKFEPVLLKDGGKAYIWRVFYYTFFGHDRIVAGHYQRTKEDIKDRLLKGYDQRWAYATFSAFITKRHFDQGIHGGSIKVMDEEEIKEHINEFLDELLPMVVSPPGEGRDKSLEEGKILGS